jgi:hypothetical protein
MLEARNRISIAVSYCNKCMEKCLKREIVGGAYGRQDTSSFLDLDR